MMISEPSMTRSHPVLVTGASGLLGANLAMEWFSRGWQLIVLYGRHPVSFGVPAFAIDLRERERTRKVIEDQSPAWIVHCAAATNVDWCENHPGECHEVNVDASRNLAVAAKAIGARLIYISTDAVFDGKRKSYDESDLVCPLNVYAKSKVLAEHAVTEILPDSLIIRTNIFGWNLQAKLSLAEWMLQNFETGTFFQGFDDVVFSPLLANDLSTVLAEMMTLGLKGIFHVASSESCSKFEFAEQIADLFGHDRRLVKRAQIGESKSLARRPNNMSLDTSKLTRALSHRTPTIREGLERFKSLRTAGFVTRLKMAML
jgi:dTDP-4-dehydrorhamnose reductase